MDYIPNTDRDRAKMLSYIGASSVDELFRDIPKQVALIGELPLPDALSEAELVSVLRSMSEKDLDLDHHVSFLGAGSYNHFVPAVVKHLVSRAEFYTAYTPYQAEISQGMLQAIYEYQSLICALTGMDVANASMYDGATAAAEATSLAVHHTGRREVVLSVALHPEFRAVIKTYGKFAGWEIKEASITKALLTDHDQAKKLISENTACFILSQPNFFGCIEEVRGLADAVHSKGALFIVSVDPISLGLLKAPGEYGADVVVGEGSSMGSPPAFGGPLLGIFAVKKEFVRLMPGRLSGATVDSKGRRGFVLTLQTREQHIRREKATSNICSNEALLALAAAIYLSAMGPRGLRRVAELCVSKAAYAKETLSKIRGYSLSSFGKSFKEFVLSCPTDPAELNRALLSKGISGGLPLSRFYPEMKKEMLICVTELTGKKDIDRLSEELSKIR